MYLPSLVRALVVPEEKQALPLRRHLEGSQSQEANSKWDTVNSKWIRFVDGHNLPRQGTTFLKSLIRWLKRFSSP